MPRKIEITIEKFGKQLAVLELNEAQIPLSFSNLSQLTRLVTVVKKAGPLLLINIQLPMSPEGSIASGYKTGEVLTVPSSKSLAIVTQDKDSLPLEVYKAGTVKDVLENLLKLEDGSIVTLKARIIAEEEQTV